MTTLTLMSSIAFLLQTSRPVIRKEGKMPESYKIPEDSVALNISTTIKGDNFPMHTWLTNELGSLAYKYWTSTNAELVETTRESETQYYEFADMPAFFAYLTGKATGGKITKDMRNKAANDVADVLTSLEAPADTLKAVRELIQSSTLTVVYDLHMQSPEMVDTIITYLESTDGNLAVLQNWRDGVNYVPPTKQDIGGLASALSALGA